MGDEKEIMDTAKEHQAENEGGADSSSKFAAAGHEHRDDSGARVDGGKAETDKPAPDWAQSETESGTRLFPKAKGPGGS
jgi:hypothetical protein